MTTLNRMLAIRAIAAGAYRVSGPCFDCGHTEGLVAFPLPFSPSIAICRRCRFNRTGIEDRRNLVTAYVRPADWKPPIALLPARCATPVTDADRRELLDLLAEYDRLDRELDHMIAAAEEEENDEPAILGPPDVVDFIFGPWTEADDEKRD